MMTRTELYGPSNCMVLRWRSMRAFLLALTALLMGTKLIISMCQSLTHV
uniref:Uncharacterized protein n=1 Tax=Arundo donax TaxID=35708 RepID=A0A0A9F794_ARUDO